MKLDVTIKYICDNPRMYQAKDENGLPSTQNGQPVYKPIYTIRVLRTNTEDEFAVEAFRTKEQLEEYGIKPGYKGTMDISFEVKNSTKNSGLFQSIKFKRFQLDNAGIFNENPQAASGAAPQPAQQPAPIPANDTAAQQGEVTGDEPF